jgi:peptidoglycan hydrolase-like protein with peptidoglycan-binding domain
MISNFLENMVPLEDGAYDKSGYTFDKSDHLVSNQELVKSLQELLASFGFGVTKVPSGRFDIPTRHAVREFQREAKRSDRVSNGAIVDPSTVNPFPGTISGKIDEATIAELRVWQSNAYRSSATFYVIKDGGRINDVGYASPDISGARVFRGDGAPLGQVVGNGAGLRNLTGTLLADALNNPDLAQRFAGTTWEKRALCEVAYNEAQVFEALNTYDNAYLSVGLFQWTLTSELPGICSTLAAADFTRLFGKWGLEIAQVKGTFNETLLRGKFKLDGVILTSGLMQEFRSFRWANRFYEASRDPAFQIAQYEHTRSRLNVVLRLPLVFAQVETVARQLLQSELLRAVALDQHVNRPAHVPGALQACADALHDPEKLVSETGEQGTWIADDHSNRMKRAAQHFHGKSATAKDLTPDEVAEVKRKIRQELSSIKKECLDVDTPSITINLEGHLDNMTQAQHDALASLYRWRRENTGDMTHPDKRWDSIEQGNHTGSLGNLSRTPNDFTL